MFACFPMLRPSQNVKIPLEIPPFIKAGRGALIGALLFCTVSCPHLSPLRFAGTRKRLSLPIALTVCSLPSTAWPCAN